MKLMNPTEKLISVSVPIKIGKHGRTGSKWYHVEKDNVIDMDDKHAWRGKAHGLVAVDKNNKVIESSVNPDKTQPVNVNVTDFTVLNGIDSELETILKDKYKDLTSMKFKANKDDLVAISGIGNKRADNILEQLKNF